MNSFRAALFALLFVGAAFARPVVLEEVATLSPPPDGTWDRLGRLGVAIDGEFALANAERSFPDPYQESGIRYEVAVFIYQRSGTNWVYSGQLGPTATLYDNSTPCFAMKGGIAVVSVGAARIFERSSTTWTEATDG